MENGWYQGLVAREVNRKFQIVYYKDVKLMFRYILKQNKNKLRGLSPQANYTDRETAACRRS
jgi:hypothetical protein